MSDEELARHIKKGYGRRVWDSHGSWFGCGLVALLAYLAGVQHMAYNATQQSKIAATLYVEQDNKRIERIRELLAENQVLRDQLMGKAAAAVEKATEAAQGVQQVIQSQPTPVEPPAQ